MYTIIFVDQLAQTEKNQALAKLLGLRQVTLVVSIVVL